MGCFVIDMFLIIAVMVARLHRFMVARCECAARHGEGSNQKKKYPANHGANISRICFSYRGEGGYRCILNCCSANLRPLRGRSAYLIPFYKHGTPIGFLLCYCLGNPVRD